MTTLLRQFLSFAGAGAVATLAHYLALIALVEGGLTGPVVASAVGAVLGALVSYTLNYRLTFAAEAPHRKTLPRFFVVASVAFVLNVTLMHVLTACANWPYLGAQVPVTAILLLVTFTANRIWTFDLR